MITMILIGKLVVDIWLVMGVIRGCISDRVLLMCVGLIIDRVEYRRSVDGLVWGGSICTSSRLPLCLVYVLIKRYVDVLGMVSV